MGGYIANIRNATGDPPIREPQTPFVIHVQDEPGSTKEMLTTAAGRQWRRGELTVFASLEEALKDAWRRIHEAEGVKK